MNQSVKNVLDQVHFVKNQSIQLFSMTEEQRKKSLTLLAQKLREQKKNILEENEKDLIQARVAVKDGSMSLAMLDRLTVSEKLIESLALACEEISRFPQVVGEIVELRELANGLKVQKQRVPLGLVAMIFESRPNVVIEALALAIKSGNALILKGGKEAQHSNQILFDVAMSAIGTVLPTGAFLLLHTREEVSEILKCQEIDLMIPRGGSSLVQFVKANALMPVIAHDRGLCHVYIDRVADDKCAYDVVINSKVQRPGVCNAMECLLVHRDFVKNQRVQLLDMLSSLQRKGVVIKGCADSQKLSIDLPQIVEPATDADYATEYLDLKMSMKIVDNEQDAVAHIQKFGSHHTEAIISELPESIDYFLNHLDASCLVVNVSTRFNDGGSLGLGAEIGISTSKLHAYGPMGARELTTTRFVVRGHGQVR